MPSVGYFLELLGAFARRDFGSVVEIGRRLADEERKLGHYKVAHDVLHAIEVAASQSGFDRIGTFSAPTASPQSAPPEVLHLEQPTEVVRPVFAEELQSKINELIVEWEFEDRLREKGLAPRHTLLLFGPPGCGKTMLAKHLAERLKMPLYTVRFDTLISSYLGQTGSNLRAIFDFAAQNRCALLIDEIDAIAKLRDDRNELGELKRVVISLLQNFDLLQTRSLLIGATNHPHMLDPALWRRFELVLELNLPGPNERERLFREYLGNEAHKLAAALSRCTEGLSGADLREIVLAAKRRSLIAPARRTEEAFFASAIEYLKRIGGAGNEGRETSDKAVVLCAYYLKKLAGKNYSFGDLERLTGIPHSTLHHKFGSIDENL